MSDFARAQEELIALRSDMREIHKLATNKPTVGSLKDIAEIAKRHDPDKPA